LRSTRCCEKFIELLSSLPERFGVRLHGYALMGNHYYLQLEDVYFQLSLPPAAFVDEFRKCYGPTMNAFEVAGKYGQAADLQKELEELFTSAPKRRKAWASSSPT
jgi:hypothetical protein